MHVTFSKQKNSFEKITAFWTKTIFRFDNFQVRLQYWVARLCNQHLPGFASNQLETSHKCYKHNEDVQVTFSKQENHF